MNLLTQTTRLKRNTLAIKCQARCMAIKTYGRFSQKKKKRTYGRHNL